MNERTNERTYSVGKHTDTLRDEQESDRLRVYHTKRNGKEMVKEEKRSFFFI